MQLAKLLEHTFSCQFYHKLYTAEDKTKLWQQAPMGDQNNTSSFMVPASVPNINSREY